MLTLRLYINGAAFTAPGPVVDEDTNHGEHQSRRATYAKEPDYTGIIPPMQLRRMSKAVRMSIGASVACLSAAGIESPDAIAVGTALGCLQDTETFLNKMIVQDEQMLTPTAFIQSTHNTVAGQIALYLNCRGFNTTVSQRGHSFEGAVLNAALYLAEHNDATILCGGVDELTDTAHRLLRRGGYYTGDAIAGEGVGFLLLSKAANGPEACIIGLHIFTESSPEAAASKLTAILEEARPERDLLYLDTKDGLGRKLQSCWSGAVQHKDAGNGDWETSIAVTIAQLAQNWPGPYNRIWLVRDAGCGDYAVWILARDTVDYNTGLT